MVTVMVTSQNDTAVLNFAAETLPPKKYYFTIRVTKGKNTILIEGTFNIVKGKLYDRVCRSII